MGMLATKRSRPRIEARHIERIDLSRREVNRLVTEPVPGPLGLAQVLTTADYVASLGISLLSRWPDRGIEIASSTDMRKKPENKARRGQAAPEHDPETTSRVGMSAEGAAVDEGETMASTGDEEGAFVGGFAFCLALMVPYLLWRRRRRQKRGPAIAAPADERLRSIEQSVEAIAVEMERIGEGQRFMSRLFTERGGISALGEGTAQPVGVPARERTPQTPR